MMITAGYAGLCGLLLIVLSYRVVRLRRRLKVGIGTGGQEELARAIRVQGNFTEYVPLILVLLALAEIQGLTGWAMHLAGAALVFGRVLHAWGLGQSAGRSPGRFVGTSLTWLVLFALSLVNLGGMLWFAG